MQSTIKFIQWNGLCGLALAACVAQADPVAAGPAASPASAASSAAVPAPVASAPEPKRLRRSSAISSSQAGGLLGDNETLMLAYGQNHPTLRCAPLHLCVIRLMAGESITNISIGDSVRWKLDSSRAGDTPVIVLKPLFTGLETNLTVLTDAGRVYYMILRSTASQSAVPLVQFYSPQDLLIQVNERKDQEQVQARQAQEKRDASLGKLDPATLDFAYACTGQASFRPTEVFSGGGHVYLKMPEDMQYHDAPAVFDTSGDGAQLINSRYARGYEVLDGLPEKFKLVVGVGSQAQSVECTHGSSKTTGSARETPAWSYGN